MECMVNMFDYVSITSSDLNRVEKVEGPVGRFFMDVLKILFRLNVPFSLYHA